MRGFTLIEQMIVVAIIGIAIGVSGNAALKQQNDGLAEVQRVRAEQLLGYEAECLSAGRPVSPATLARLSENLPRVTVARERQAAATRVVVSWFAPNGQPESRSVSVFARGAR